MRKSREPVHRMYRAVMLSENAIHAINALGDIETTVGQRAALNPVITALWARRERLYRWIRERLVEPPNAAPPAAAGPLPS